MLLIGRKFSKSIYDDGHSLQIKYKEPKYLMDLDIFKFIKEHNQILVKFLCGISSMDLERESNQLHFAFASAIEMFYYLRNLNLVLPHSFLGNLVQSCTSGSKSLSVVNGKTSPGGGYTTFRNWIELKGSTPLNCMHGSIDVYFDNIGKYIVKSYRVSSTKTKTADIITTAILSSCQRERMKQSI